MCFSCGVVSAAPGLTPAWVSANMLKAGFFSSAADTVASGRDILGAAA